jgi:hypothetical protein
MQPEQYVQKYIDKYPEEGTVTRRQPNPATLKKAILSQSDRIGLGENLGRNMYRVAGLVRNRSKKVLHAGRNVIGIKKSESFYRVNFYIFFCGSGSGSGFS